MYSTALITLLVATVLSLQSVDCQEAYSHINSGQPEVRGVLSLVKTENGLYILGTVKGLTPGPHGFHIHSNGNVSEQCKNVGGHYNPFNKSHGCGGKESHLGDLGNIYANKKGIAKVKLMRNDMELVASTGTNNGIGGLTFGIDQKMDNCVNENISVPPIGCGIITLLPQ